MTEVKSYRDLQAWQRAFELGLAVYDATKKFPRAELYGLALQLRRAAVSVASNIAEGYGRGSTSDYLRYLRMARGSLYEVDTQLLYAHEFEYVDRDESDQLEELLGHAGRTLAGLIRGVEQSTTA